MKNIFKNILETSQFDFFYDKMSQYVSKNDTVYVELDLMNFAMIDSGVVNKRDFLEFFFQLFSELIGEKGNLIVPTFSYSWGDNKKQQVFDVINTKAFTGIFPNYLLEKKEVIRTIDPIFSTAVMGYDKKYLIDNGNSSFNKNSIFNKLFEMNAKLISFGLTKFDPTFVHFVEQYFDENFSKIDYRYLKKMHGIIIDYDGKSSEQRFFSFLRNMNKNMKFNEIKIKKDLLKANLYSKFKILNGDIHICYANDFFNIGIAGMKKDMHYFVK